MKSPSSEIRYRGNATGTFSATKSGSPDTESAGGEILEGSDWAKFNDLHLEWPTRAPSRDRVP